MSHLAYLAAAAALAATAACTDDPTDPTAPIVDSGAYHHFVQTAWDLPLDEVRPAAFAFDFDDDGYPDNQLGQWIASLDALGLDVSSANTEAFMSGNLVLLHSARADSLATDGSVSWQLLAGLPAATAPRFDGTDAFAIGADHGLLVGATTAGMLDAGFGNVVLRVPFFPGQPPLPFPLTHARIEMDVREGRPCRGRIGGVLTRADRDAIVLPILAAQTLNHLAAHAEHRFAREAIRFFDRNRDGTATAAEIEETSRSLVTADVELDDDGVSDSAGDGTSLGLGLRCAPATFTVPGE